MTTPEPALYRPKNVVDVLNFPILGRLLKARYGRLVLQIPFLVVAVFVLFDGFTGPQVAPKNLATVAPWVHYRGIVVIALLLAGNLFCMSCPFTVPRTLAKKLSISGRRFPQIFRNRWLAIGSLFVMFFLYEWLDLWASPILTAWVVLFYFIASFVMEAVFTESAFCKYVCPLGTFNFVYSTASPTQIGVKNPNTCATCVGKECVNGDYAPVVQIVDIATDGTHGQHSPQGTLGCGTELFAPQIKSNMDCTMCLDCVRTCPHDNVGLLARLPGRELLQTDVLPKRWDMSLLLIALAFMGVSNAFGMVPPVYELEASLIETFNFQSEFPVLLIIFSLLNLVLPFAIAVGAGWMSQTFTNTKTKYSLREIVSGFAPAFVPLGFGIWIAHYSFHFLIAPGSIIPVLQEFFGGVGEVARFSGSVDVQIIGLIQVIALVGGFLWSMVVAQKTSIRLFRRQGMLGLMPWAFVLLLLMLASWQIFSLPMEMRGTEFLFN